MGVWQWTEPTAVPPVSTFARPWKSQGQGRWATCSHRNQVYAETVKSTTTHDTPSHVRPLLGWCPCAINRRRRQFVAEVHPLHRVFRQGLNEARRWIFVDLRSGARHVERDATTKTEATPTLPERRRWTHRRSQRRLRARVTATKSSRRSWGASGMVKRQPWL